LTFRGSWSDDEAVVVASGHRRALSGSGGSDRLVSIVLPVKNAAAELRVLLPRILSQRCDRDIELLAVDSGSEDETVEVLRTFDATILGIDPRSFNYGLTRNLAARVANGEYLVFVTARSLPADDRWLANLIGSLDRDERVAGAFSRCLPRPDADLLTRRDDLHWASIVERLPGTREIQDWDVYLESPPAKRFEQIIFSNVSAAIRTSVFSQFPFQAATHGEDMLWARTVLEAGYKIVYEPTSVVLRSHRYSPLDLFRRNFDAGVSAGESAGMRPDPAECMQTVMQAILSDWLYLENGCGLRGEDLDGWRIDSVIHRAAQHFGFCLGANVDFLPSDVRALAAMVERESGSESTRAYARFFSSCLESDSRDRDDLPHGNDTPSVREKIEAAWRDIAGAGHPMSEIEQLQLDAAITQVLNSAATWLAQNPTYLASPFKSSFSLIGAIKSGSLTEEMQSNLHHLPIQLQDDLEPSEASSPWRGDARSVLSALDAYAAELRFALARIDTATRDQQREIDHRERVIRELQTAMEHEIQHRDATIREMQSAMGVEIRHREMVAMDLQTALNDEIRNRERFIDGSQTAHSTGKCRDEDPVERSRSAAIPAVEPELRQRVLILEQDVRTQREEINRIYSTRVWRAVSLYWATRNKMQRLLTRLKRKQPDAT
jgi:rhamnosyltransferase